MYALINTMSRLDNYVGSIQSIHRTKEAAESADARLQRFVRKYNGSNSYLPTTVAPLVKGRYRRGQMLHSSDVLS
jgi:hypothetical protein